MKRAGTRRVRVSRVVLVGLPGSGKTTVAPMLAQRLGWEPIDADLEVERAAGLDIGAIFRTHGEAGFRRLESETVARALRRERAVIAPGAGWAAQPGALDGVGPDTVLVWLRVGPGEAARRLRATPGRRPLLAHGDMAAHLERMNAERAPSYERAQLAVDTEGRAPEDVAAMVAARLVSEYGIDGRSD